MPAARTRPFYDGDRYVPLESVGHQLFHLTQLMRRAVDARMAAHDLTDAQWKPLWLIASGRACTANELARCTEVDAGAITRMLDRLEAKGLLERVRSDTDRRVVQLQLTPAGVEAARRVPQVLAEVNNEFLRGFSTAEWKQLRTLLERLAANGQALRENAETPA